MRYRQNTKGDILYGPPVNVRFAYSSIKILFKRISLCLRELLICSLINVIYQHFVFSILFSTMSKKNVCVLTLIDLDDYSLSK